MVAVPTGHRVLAVTVACGWRWTGRVLEMPLCIGEIEKNFPWSKKSSGFFGRYLIRPPVWNLLEVNNNNNKKNDYMFSTRCWVET